MAFNNVTYDENRARIFFRQELLPEIQDTIFQANPFFAMVVGSLAKGGRQYSASSEQLATLKGKMGGIKGSTSRLWVEEVIEVDQFSGNVATGSGGQIISNTPQETRTKAIWQLTPRFASVALPTEEYLAAKASVESSGNYDVMSDLLLREGEQAYKALFDLCGGEVWGTNTDSESGLISLVNGISTSTEVAGYASYGGQSSATWASWDGNYSAGTYASILDNTAASYMDTMLGNAVQTVLFNGADIKDLVWVFGSSIYGKYRDYLNALYATGVQTGFRTDPKGGEGLPGWTGLAYTQIPVMADPHVGAQTANLIDVSKLKLKALPNALFSMSDWQQSESVTQNFARISFVGQLITLNRRNNYRIVWS